VTLNPNTPLREIPPATIGTQVPAGDSVSAASFGNETQGRRTPFELWLHRITVLLFVFVCAAAGVLLVIVPWRPEWTDNRLLLGNPWLQAFVANAFVRGLVSGIGVLDIWIGFWEAVHYHDQKRT